MPALRSLLLVVGCIALACGGSNTPIQPSQPAATFSTFQSPHYRFRYTSIDAASISQTAGFVEAEYARVTGDLGVADMPAVTVTLYPNIDALRQAVAPIVGSIPSFATGLITSAEAIHILSPNLAATWTYRDGVGTIVHEFAHCVSLRLNPTIANNPRWLWESVALFEALQYDNARTRPVVTAGPLPSLAQLSSLENATIYGVGAWLGRFVAETRGWDAYRELIRNNGDLSRTFGTTEAAFLSDWAAFVRERIQ